MKRLVFIFFFCNIYFNNYSQSFVVETPKQKKNEFAKNFVKLLNSAPDFFKEFKDKPFKEIDSVYPKVPVFQNKIKLFPIFHRAANVYQFLITRLIRTFLLRVPKYIFEHSNLNLFVFDHMSLIKKYTF